MLAVEATNEIPDAADSFGAAHAPRRTGPCCSAATLRRRPRRGARCVFYISALMLQHTNKTHQQFSMLSMFSSSACWLGEIR